jgi:hypothetical protein
MRRANERSHGDRQRVCVTAVTSAFGSPFIPVSCNVR